MDHFLYMFWFKTQSFRRLESLTAHFVDHFCPFFETENKHLDDSNHWLLTLSIVFCPFFDAENKHLEHSNHWLLASAIILFIDFHKNVFIRECELLIARFVTAMFDRAFQPLYVRARRACTSQTGKLYEPNQATLQRKLCEPHLLV